MIHATACTPHGLLPPMPQPCRKGYDHWLSLPESPLTLPKDWPGMAEDPDP